MKCMDMLTNSVTTLQIIGEKHFPNLILTLTQNIIKSYGVITKTI